MFTVVLSFTVACDVMLALGLLGHLLAGGLHGMNDWIMHIGAEGGIHMVQDGPGAVQMRFPSKATVYARFACSSGFLLLLTAGSWWGRRILQQNAKSDRAMNRG